MLACDKFAQNANQIIKVDIEVEDEAGNTAMNDAARNGHLKIVDILCDNKGNMEHANLAGCTPFLNATLCNKGAAVRPLQNCTALFAVTHSLACINTHLLRSMSLFDENVSWTL
jgi:ankyrin repeat protein